MPGWRRGVKLASRRSLAYRARQTTRKIRFPFELGPAPKRPVETTPPGMAHLSGTGPPGTVCEQCGYYGMEQANCCFRYFVMALNHGAAFPPETPSCQYFSPR
jgi:hypothetical protein